MAEANVQSRDIQALYCGNGLSDFSEGQIMIQSYIADSLGCRNIPATRFEAACSSATVAIRDAYMWVASGFYDIVLVGGTEKATAMGTALATRTFAMGTDARYEFPAGLTFPGFFGLLANLYASKYKVPFERLRHQMSLVSVQSHSYGVNNPHAQFKKEITVDKVEKAFMVASPLTLLDCCPFSDGAAALVIASEEKARKLCDTPIYIAGVGQASSGMLSSQYKNIPPVKSPGYFRKTGLRHGRGGTTKTLMCVNSTIASVLPASSPPKVWDLPNLDKGVSCGNKKRPASGVKSPLIFRGDSSPRDIPSGPPGHPRRWKS